MAAIKNNPREYTSSPSTRITAFILLIAVTAALYIRTGSHGFIVYDDTSYVPENPMVRNGLTWEGVKWAFTSLQHSNWFPLTWLSHMLDVTLFGLDAGRHHLVNVLLHLLNTSLLLLLLKRMTGAYWRSLSVAALFALHPLHVESVAWIAERKDLLCTLLLFFCILLYHRYTCSPTVPRYLAVALTFALSLASKPMAVTLPLLLLILDFWPLERASIKAGKIAGLILEKLPLFALSAAASYVTYLAQHQGGTVRRIVEQTFLSNVRTAVTSYAAYLEKMLVPTGLSIFYPFREASWGETLLALAVTGGISWVCFRFRQSKPYLLAGWSWYLVLLLPVIGFVRFGDHAYADRYTYIPLIGIFTALVWLIADTLRTEAATRTAACIFLTILSILSFLTFRQAGNWKSTYTVFNHALSVTEDNWLAHGNVGATLVEWGQVNEGRKHLTEALRINPHDANSLANMGIVYNNMRETGRAIEFFRKALASDPSHVTALYNLGIAYRATGMRLDAMETYTRLLAINHMKAGYLLSFIRQIDLMEEQQRK